MSEEQPQLSDRELELLRLLANGASNKEIAQALVISVNTVKVHVRNIYAKLGVSSRTEATLWAVREGLVDPYDEADTPDGSAGQEPGDGGEVIVSPPPAANEDAPSEDQDEGRRRWMPWLIAFAAVLILALAAVGVWAIWPRPAVENGDTPANDPAVSPSETLPWEARAELSVPRSHFASAVYDGQIFAIGGAAENGVIGSVESYNPELDQWYAYAKKPQAVQEIAAAVIGGMIYVPGGETADGRISSQLEVFDPQTNTWESRAALPEGRSAYALSAFEGKLYLFGGWDGARFVDNVFVYSPEDDNWHAGEPMPTARGYAGAAQVGGRVYVFGGYDGENALKVNEVYDPGTASGTWSSGTELPQGRYGMGAASLAETIYVVGGEGENVSVQSFQFAPQEGEWLPIEASTDQQTWSFLGLAPLGSHLHVFGGRLGEQVTGQHWSYQVIYTIVLPIIQQD